MIHGKVWESVLIVHDDMLGLGRLLTRSTNMFMNLATLHRVSRRCERTIGAKVLELQQLQDGAAPSSSGFRCVVAEDHFFAGREEADVRTHPMEAAWPAGCAIGCCRHWLDSCGCFGWKDGIGLPHCRLQLVVWHHTATGCQQPPDLSPMRVPK